VEIETRAGVKVKNRLKTMKTFTRRGNFSLIMVFDKVEANAMFIYLHKLKMF
jgi:hypothetical protein